MRTKKNVPTSPTASALQSLSHIVPVFLIPHPERSIKPNVPQNILKIVLYQSIRYLLIYFYEI